MDTRPDKYLSPSQIGLLFTGLALMVLSLVLGWRAGDLPPSSNISLFERGVLVAGNVSAGMGFLLACLCVRQRQPHWMLWWVIAVGVACRVALVVAPPVLATDANRYLWDGMVWLHGYDPWRYSPAAALDGGYGVPTALHQLATGHKLVIDQINHNSLPTIYPPVSEAVFAASAWLAPWSMIMLKVWLLLFDVGTASLLWLILRRLKLPPLWLLIYWWNPVAINAFANEAHLDAIVVFFVALFWYWLMARRAIGAGLALGLAIGAKLWPVILVAVLGRKYLRHPRQLLAASMAVVATSAVVLWPMLAGGSGNFTSMAEYARYWQANDLVYRLVWEFWGSVLHSWNDARTASTATVAVIFAAATAVLIHRPIPDRQAVRVGVLLTGLLFLLSPTQFPWYYTWLLPMLAINPRPSLLAWSCTLGLYHWEYIGSWVVWVETLPVIILLVVEGLSPTVRDFFAVRVSAGQLVSPPAQELK
ncbi:MAG: DUF2029 domain-containing protein [Phycisphaerae bacterium]|nr:DUF2029 domain-containing protein [Phycisphaerae bacterium]